MAQKGNTRISSDSRGNHGGIFGNSKIWGFQEEAVQILMGFPC